MSDGESDSGAFGQAGLMVFGYSLLEKKTVSKKSASKVYSVFPRSSRARPTRVLNTSVLLSFVNCGYTNLENGQPHLQQNN